MISELIRFFHQKAILIVDDDYTSILLLEEYLSQIMTNILKADSCEEAKEKFLKNPEIQLVLLDIRLADGCGIELSGHLKEIRSDVLIIAQTALSIDQSLDSNEEYNFDACIRKPINQNVLFESISKLVKDNTRSSN